MNISAAGRDLTLVDDIAAVFDIITKRKTVRIKQPPFRTTNNQRLICPFPDIHQVKPIVGDSADEN